MHQYLSHQHFAWRWIINSAFGSVLVEYKIKKIMLNEEISNLAQGYIALT